MVVSNELSSFKLPTAKRFKSLRKSRPQVKRIVGLTGTPVPNSLLDLWSEINLQLLFIILFPKEPLMRKL